MNQKQKIKVVMVCNLSNPMVRSHLPLGKVTQFNSLRSFFGIPKRNQTYCDVATWNAGMAAFLGGRDDVDFHIISSHIGMKEQRCEFVDHRVHYVFLNHFLASVLHRIIRKYSWWRAVNPFSKTVKKEIDRINPDIVVLQGTENAGYSCTVLGVKKYPVYLMCQTVYNNPERIKFSTINQDNALTELDLFKSFRYFGVYCKMHYDLVRSHCPQAIIFKFGYPSRQTLLQPVETNKEFDFVNFAMEMSAKKGFPDSIQALAIVKEKYPQVKLNLVGPCSDERKRELMTLINQLTLQDNVVFTPFFEKRSDLFLHIQKSRFALLPCKMDNTSGTMSQAMQLGLPLVVYKTTGTPSFNREKQCALIAEHSNVHDLASKMLLLMDNSDLAETLRKNARVLQEKRVEEASHNGERLIENFMAIIANFHDGTPIPQDLLFDPDMDD